MESGVETCHSLGSNQRMVDLCLDRTPPRVPVQHDLDMVKENIRELGTDPMGGVVVLIVSSGVCWAD